MGFGLFQQLIENRRIVAIALLTATALAIFGISRMQFEESTRDVLYSTPECSALLDQVELSFGSDQNDCYVILLGDPIFSSEGLTILRDFVARARALDGVATVNSMLDARRHGRFRMPLVPSEGAAPDLIARRRDEALEHPLVRGHLLSDDASAALVTIRLAGSQLDVKAMHQVVDPLHALLQEVTARTPVRGLMTGLAPVNCDIVRTVQRVMVWFSLTASLVCLAIAVWIFRSASAAMVTFVAPVIGCLWALGLLSFVGLKFNVVHSIMPTLVIATGFSDAVHLMYHFRGLVRKGVQKHDAVIRTVTSLGPACAMTSMTTAIGFGSLALSRMPVVKVFGIACALGCALTFVSVIVTFVAITEIAPFPWKASESHVGTARMSWPDRLLRWVARHRIPVSIMSAAGVVAMAPLFAWLQPDYRYAYSLPAGSESAEAMQVCDQKFGGSLLALVLMRWSENNDEPATILPVVQQVHQAIEAESGLAPPLSVLTALSALTSDRNLADDWDRLDRLPAEAVQMLIRKDHRALVVVTRMKDRGSRENLQSLSQLRSRLKHLDERHVGMELDVSGLPPMVFESVNQIIRDLSGCLVVASVVIFILLTACFRSISLGLISVIPNAFPVVALAAMLVTCEMPLTYVSVLVFTIALGIAVDDTIHFIFRYQRELMSGEQNEQAVRLAYAAVAPAMLTTTAIFTLAFSTLWISRIPQHHSLALLCATAMILALVGDLLILPAWLLLRGATDHHNRQDKAVESTG